MPLWPFGRKRTAKLNDGPTPVSDDKRSIQGYPGNAPRNMAGAAQSNVSRRRSRRRIRVSGNSSPYRRDKEISHSPPRLPVDLLSEKRRTPHGSVEDITALPVTKELGTSPHLRPIAQDRADIPYSFRPQSRSHTSLPSARERGKLQRPESLRYKRSAQDSGLLRRTSSKKRKNDHVREEEIRAMSAPIPMKRPATYSAGLMRRDSKKMRSGLNKHFERPTSNISLPLEDSVHSSMSGSSETREFRVSALDIFTPRPKIRYSSSSQYAGGGHHSSAYPSRSESRKDKIPPVDKDPSKKSRRIDDLADDLDASALRTIMERDQRRRDRKRKTEEERMQRRLERRAEKQRAKERRKEEEEEAALVGQSAKQKQPVGLGIGEVSRRQTSKIPHQHNTTKELGTENTGTYLDYQPDARLPSTPPKPAWTTGSQQDLPAPLSPPPESPFEEPVVSTAQAVRYSQASMSPPTSPVQHKRGPSNVSQLPELLSEATPQRPEPADVPQRTESQKRGSDTSGRRRGAWASLFRRGGVTSRRDSLERGRSTPSDVSFSNTSRESMARQAPPAHLYQGQVRRASGTPVRTQSKFREDLPEFPISPPDSRVQSPEVTAAAAAAIAARRGGKAPANLHVDLDAAGPSNSFQDTLIRARTDSPVSPGGRGSILMSQSLASVDSEGSWLSGKPIRRSNPAYLRHSGGSGSPPKVTEDFSASYEELGIPDDEYFRRLTPGPHDRRYSAQSGEIFGRKPSSGAIADNGDSDTDEELRSSSTERPESSKEMFHSGVARQPTVVHREPRVKSKEGLLNYFQAGEQSASESSPSHPADSPEQELPGYDIPTEPVKIERARSVDLGKGHTRALSAGSAKLLDIPAKRQSVDQKRASSASRSDQLIE